MQYVHIVCPFCNARLRFRSAGTYKKVNCPGCHRKFFPNEATSSALEKPQEDSENVYDVGLGGRKFFSISVPRHLENVLYSGVLAMLFLLVVGAAIWLGYQGARKNRSGLSRLAQSEESAEAGGPPRAERLRADDAIDISPVDLPKYKTVPTTPVLRYQFEKGQRLTYDVSLTANNEEQKYSLEGELSYEVTSNVRVAEQTERSAGTAFVVDSNGILVTCAHVVRDAASIRVFFGEESYHAEVVAYDRKSDLALLQIEASGLPALPLESSGEIRLAQRVRLVGYPLANLLGSSAKISSGTVASSVQDLGKGRKRFQVDATFNPGNSGGPLVDDSGAVVGVASAMLAGRRLSEIGLAIPIPEISRLLSNLDLLTVFSGDGEALSGPDLAEQVVKSVALIKIVPHEAAVTRYRVDYQWRQTQANLPRAQILEDLPDSLVLLLQDAKRFPETTSGSFDIDYMGKISDYPRTDFLPFCYVQVGKLAFEELDGDREKYWTTRFEGRLDNLPAQPKTVPEEYSPPKSERDVLFIEKPGEEFLESVESYNVADRLRYFVEIENSLTAKIIVQRSFFTLGEQEPPRLVLKGKRKFDFDKKSGRIRYAGFSGVIKENSRDEIELRIPYLLRLTLRKSH